jgi:hypothetical protein
MRGVTSVKEMSEVAQLLAYLAVRLNVPTMCAKPCWGRECSVEDREKGGFLPLAGPLACEKTSNKRPMRCLHRPVRPKGEPFLKAPFLDGLKAVADVMAKKCR